MGGEAGLLLPIPPGEQIQSEFAAAELADGVIVRPYRTVGASQVECAPKNVVAADDVELGRRGAAHFLGFQNPVEVIPVRCLPFQQTDQNVT